MPCPLGTYRQGLQRTLHTHGPTPHDMGVDLGRADILVTEQLLYSANILSPLQQMGRKGVTKGVA
jgi:hypothetical protein